MKNDKLLTYLKLWSDGTLRYSVRGNYFPNIVISHLDFLVPTNFICSIKMMYSEGMFSTKPDIKMS